MAGGADVVEIGLPYSDPLMDGPVIQHAVEAALRAGTRTRDVIDAVERLAGTGAAVLVMTYWNPVERYGVDRFAADLAAAGGAGLITPDLIPDEAAGWIAASDTHGLDRVFLVAPVLHAGPAAQHRRGLPRLRLRRLDDGRHRRPAAGRRRRPGRWSRAPARSRRPAGLRRPRGVERRAGRRGRRRSPTASSSARRSCARSPTPAADAGARPRLAGAGRATGRCAARRALTASPGSHSGRIGRMAVITRCPPRSRARPRASGTSGRSRCAPTRCASCRHRRGRRGRRAALGGPRRRARR